MPCWLVVTIELKDEEAVHKAAAELGLTQRDYNWANGIVRLRRPQVLGQLKQRYGLIVAEAQARRRGYTTRRVPLEDGAIRLQVRTG